MTFSPLNQTHIKNLQSFVAPDRFSIGESALDLHSKDESLHRAQRPEAVIWPVNRSEVSEILRYADSHLIPITGWGSGSSLEGNPIPVRGGLVLDFSSMNRILETREEDFQVDVEPGVIYQDLNEGLRQKGLFFPPDPGAKATVGGMIANNASGTRTVRYGSTKDHVLRLCVVLANGEILEMGTRASKTSSGYDMIHLFVGSEGTLGVVVSATLRLRGAPEEFSAAIATFPSVAAAGKTVFEIIRSGLDPAALELLAPECLELINREENLGLDVSPTLFMEFHGPTKTHLAEVLELVRGISTDEGCVEYRPGLGRGERDRLLKARHGLADMMRRAHPGTEHIVIDVAVPITAYPEMITYAGKESEKTPIPTYIFGHAGDGNLHLAFQVKRDDEKEWNIIDKINRNVVSKALSVGGTATGEHGVGIGKRQFMEAEHGNGLEWMRRIKGLFDPNGILNPGKIFP